MAVTFVLEVDNFCFAHLLRDHEKDWYRGLRGTSIVQGVRIQAPWLPDALFLATLLTMALSYVAEQTLESTYNGGDFLRELLRAENCSSWSVLATACPPLLLLLRVVLQALAWADVGGKGWAVHALRSGGAGF